MERMTGRCKLSSLTRRCQQGQRDLLAAGVLRSTLDLLEVCLARDVAQYN